MSSFISPEQTQKAKEMDALHIMSNKRKYLVYCQKQKSFDEVDKDYYYKFYRFVWALS